MGEQIPVPEHQSNPHTEGRKKIILQETVLTATPHILGVSTSLELPPLTM